MRTRWMAGTAPHKSARCRDESGFAISATDKYRLESRYREGATGLNTGCT